MSHIIPDTTNDRADALLHATVDEGAVMLRTTCEIVADRVFNRLMRFLTIDQQIEVAKIALRLTSQL